MFGDAGGLLRLRGPGRGQPRGEAPSGPCLPRAPRGPAAAEPRLQPPSLHRAAAPSRRPRPRGFPGVAQLPRALRAAAHHRPTRLLGAIAGPAAGLRGLAPHARARLPREADELGAAGACAAVPPRHELARPCRHAPRPQRHRRGRRCRRRCHRAAAVAAVFRSAVAVAVRCAGVIRASAGCGGAAAGVAAVAAGRVRPGPCHAGWKEGFPASFCAGPTAHATAGAAATAALGRSTGRARIAGG
mmetsp:Transcript_103840/g.332814  ORF Transcript_103840/g.332814 Transcript_103840/m.332814 type:complete len:244 (+) Transcript_103840:899-1630(+)